MKLHAVPKCYPLNRIHNIIIPYWGRGDCVLILCRLSNGVHMFEVSLCGKSETNKKPMVVHSGTLVMMCPGFWECLQMLPTPYCIIALSRHSSKEPQSCILQLYYNTMNVPFMIIGHPEMESRLKLLRCRPRLTLDPLRPRPRHRPRPNLLRIAPRPRPSVLRAWQDQDQFKTRPRQIPTPWPTILKCHENKAFSQISQQGGLAIFNDVTPIVPQLKTLY